jgi:hypothetical protein
VLGDCRRRAKTHTVKAPIEVLAGLMQQGNITLIVAGIGIGGTLGGIVVGHILTRSWQQQQWELDRRNEEWRELLTALADSLRVALKIYPMRALDPDEQREIVEAHANCFRVIRDRIFIASDVKALDLENRWSAAVQHHSQTLDPNRVGSVYNGIRLEIVKIATEKA